MHRTDGPNRRKGLLISASKQTFVLCCATLIKPTNPSTSTNASIREAEKVCYANGKDSLTREDGRLLENG
jgi:hypothetical protein